MIVDIQDASDGWIEALNSQGIAIQIFSDSVHPFVQISVVQGTRNRAWVELNTDSALALLVQLATAIAEVQNRT